MSVKPISPDEVAVRKAEALPNEVIEAFNELITENWNGTSAAFTQNAAVDRILAKFLPPGDTKPSITCQTLFDRGWLDVEPVFKAVGWEVEYDKPGFNESYPATFTFRRK